MIVGLISVGDGKILVDETDVTHEPVNVRAGLGVGYLPQDASIFRKLSVECNIMAILEMRSELGESGRKKMAQKLMDELGISHLADQMGISLSGGERRRRRNCQGFGCQPKIYSTG